jgi:hypothetical protein
MIRTYHVAFAVLFPGLCNIVSAGDFAYACKISHVYNLGNDESLETSPELEKIIKESTFSVSRETGALIGNSIAFDTSLAKQTRVINRGSTTNSFEAIADFGKFKNGTHPFQFIKISEFRTGADKPFVLMGEVGIATGVCK